jgi:hypothetical protein
MTGSIPRACSTRSTKTFILSRPSTGVSTDRRARICSRSQQGKARQPDIVWHGTQPCRVCLKERKLRVNKPRFRKKGRGTGDPRTRSVRRASGLLETRYGPAIAMSQERIVARTCAAEISAKHFKVPGCQGDDQAGQLRHNLRSVDGSR